MGNELFKRMTDLYISVLKVLKKYHFFFHRNDFPFKLDNLKFGTVNFSGYI